MKLLHYYKYACFDKQKSKPSVQEKYEVKKKYSGDKKRKKNYSQGFSSSSAIVGSGWSGIHFGGSHASSGCHFVSSGTDCGAGGGGGDCGGGGC